MNETVELLKKTINFKIKALSRNSKITNRKYIKPLPSVCILIITSSRYLLQINVTHVINADGF